MADFAPAFDDLDFSEALKPVWALVAETDGYLTANAPWKKPPDRSDADHAALQARVLATAAEAIRVITALAYPILPEAAAKVWHQIGQGEIAEAAKNAFLSNLAWGGLKPGTKFGEPAPLFPRAEKDAVERMQNLEEENNRSAIEAASAGESGGESGQIAPGRATAAPSVAPSTGTGKEGAHANEELTPTTAVPHNVGEGLPTAHVHAVPADQASARLSTSPVSAPAAQPGAGPINPAEGPGATQITIDDFARVDLRVARVLVAERVPKADKLLRLEVDLGYETRQILAGIAQYYEPEKLVGRKIVVVANLAPRKMRGLESNGMLLAASLPDGAPVLAGFLEEVPLGARLK